MLTTPSGDDALCQIPDVQGGTTATTLAACDIKPSASSSLSVEDPAGGPAKQVAMLSDDCNVRWRWFPHDVIPPVPPGAILLDWSEEVFVPLSERRGVCHKDGEIGYLLFGGEDGGGCVLSSKDSKPVFGGFELLIASVDATSGTAAHDKDCLTNQGELKARIARQVAAYMSTDDIATIEDITGHDFLRGLLEPLLTEDACVLGNVLSNERFVPHALNVAGLHLLRCVLAERMTDARRAAVRARACATSGCLPLHLCASCASLCMRLCLCT